MSGRREERERGKKKNIRRKETGKPKEGVRSLKVTEIIGLWEWIVATGLL